MALGSLMEAKCRPSCHNKNNGIQKGTVPLKGNKTYGAFLCCLMLILSLAGCALQESSSRSAPLQTGDGGSGSLSLSSEAASQTSSSQSLQVSQSDPSESVSESDGQAAQELFAQWYPRAQELVDGMTLEEKVGQLILARCPDNAAASLRDSDLSGVEQVRQYHVGGYILFAADFEGKTPEQVRQTITSYQEASAVPLLIGVDEEGGSVVRVSRYEALADHRFASPQELYAQGGLEAVRQDAADKSQLLLSYGINMNLAPVADVSTDPSDYIYSRTFGRPAQETAQYVAAVVEEMNASHMGSCLKHFPGYGDNRDTHTGVAVDSRSYDSFVQSDFLPFSAGISQGASAVLVSHNVVQSMDGQLPASLSPAVHQVLRDTLGFTGVVMTDDLAMEAVREYARQTGSSAAVLAVQAGNDLIITSSLTQDIAQLLQAVEDGILPLSRIEESARRVVAMKLALGIAQ